MHLGLSLGLTGGGQGQAWIGTRQRLAAFLPTTDGAGNPHSLPAMASPPTVATGTAASLLDGLSQSKRWPADIASLRISAGTQEAFSIYMRYISATRSASVITRTCARVAMNCTGSKVGFQLLGHALPYRFIVDGEYVSKTGTTTASASGANYVTLDFGSSATRLVEVELQSDQAFYGVWAASFAAPPSTDFRMIVLGDSITEATGATHKGDGFVGVLADYLGIDGRIASGVASTGYVNTASSTRYKLSERVVADLARAHSEGPVHAVVVAMGINDLGLSGIQTEAARCFDLIRAVCPEAVVFVATPFDADAPAAPSANFTACKSAIVAALGSRPGFRLIDLEGVSYTKIDTVHPDDAGHVTLALAIEGQIRTALA